MFDREPFIALAGDAPPSAIRWLERLNYFVTNLPFVLLSDLDVKELQPLHAQFNPR
jgi:hypothetical protein